MSNNKFIFNTQKHKDANYEVKGYKFDLADIQIVLDTFIKKYKNTILNFIDGKSQSISQIIEIYKYVSEHKFLLMLDKNILDFYSKYESRYRNTKSLTSDPIDIKDLPQYAIKYFENLDKIVKFTEIGVEFPTTSKDKKELIIETFNDTKKLNKYLSDLLKPQYFKLYCQNLRDFTVINNLKKILCKKFQEIINNRELLPYAQKLDYIYNEKAKKYTDILSSDKYSKLVEDIKFYKNISQEQFEEQHYKCHENEYFIQIETFNKSEMCYPWRHNLKDIEENYEHYSLLYKILKSYQFINKEPIIQNFLQNYEELNNNIRRRYQRIFSIEGIELNDEQKQAVRADEQRCLVIAGAGSGKTSMLISKVAYLLEKGVSPNEILVISYTNKTVYDLKRRLAKFTSLVPMTIHSFCKNIILEDKRRCDENLLYRAIQKVKKRSSGFWENLFQYLGILSNIESDFNQIADTFNHKKITEHDKSEQTNTLLNNIEKFERKNLTLKGDKVKSLAEVKIANFLFLNGIDYEYEKVYEKQYYGNQTEENKEYKPDFCIKNGNDEIWLEHFGITTDGNGKKHASQCEDENKYLQEMEEKIKTHKNNGTHLIYTTQDMYRNNRLLKELKIMLENEGVCLHKIEDKQIKNHIVLLENREKYQNFETFLMRFINLYKFQEQYTLDDLKDLLCNEYKNLSDRTENFFKIAKLVYDEYESFLIEKNLIDFSEMIINAVKKLRNGKYVSNYKYIIVDEFQDINIKTYELLHLLQETSGAKLFCVGDDWQSIYGFAGSNLDLFKSFADNAERLFLKKAYRNSQELLTITKDFIEKNNKQIQKELEAVDNHSEHPIKVAHFHPMKKPAEGIKGCATAFDALNVIIDDINKNNESKKNSLTVLGRYNEYKATLFIDKIRNKNVKVDFMTIHKAKGLEFDNVAIFLQEGDDIFSFPSSFKDNYLIEKLLSKTDMYPNAEERRIFYVALTRCKNQCYIINSEENPSSFYDEIKDKCYSLNDTLKEYCKKTGKNLNECIIEEFHIRSTNPNINIEEAKEKLKRLLDL